MGEGEGEWEVYGLIRRRPKTSLVKFKLPRYQGFKSENKRVFDKNKILHWIQLEQVSNWVWCHFMRGRGKVCASIWGVAENSFIGF